MECYVTSLYTECIDDIINFANEHLETLNLCGFQLMDSHEMLKLVFGNTYFTYSGRVYLQCVGLCRSRVGLMRSKPSPIGAIMRVYTSQRRSVYIDPHFLPIVSRILCCSVDDAGTVSLMTQAQLF